MIRPKKNLKNSKVPFVQFMIRKRRFWGTFSRETGKSVRRGVALDPSSSAAPSHSHTRSVRRLSSWCLPRVLSESHSRVANNTDLHSVKKTCSRLLPSAQKKRNKKGRPLSEPQLLPDRGKYFSEQSWVMRKCPDRQAGRIRQ